MYADIILPLPLSQLYTYHVISELEAEAKVGKRVIVPFGKRKFYTGIIRKIHDLQPLGYHSKDIVQIIDDEPIVNDLHFSFWEWVSKYYMCTLGDVLKAALPAGLKLESETKLTLNPDFEDTDLNEDEPLIFKEFNKNPLLAVSDLKSIGNDAKMLKTVRELIRKGALLVNEEVKTRYKPIFETFVRIHPDCAGEKELEIVFKKIEKKEKQLQVLMAYIHLSNFFNINTIAEVSKKELLLKSGGTDAVLKTLVKNNVLEIYKKEISRLESQEKQATKYPLTDAQERAKEEIISLFKEKDTVLMYGVTSCGKTEIYIELIEETLKAGKQVLYLLPEIALTSQIVNRITHIFGEKVGIYHSKYSESERSELWLNISQQKNLTTPTDEDADIAQKKIVVGVRSSIFLPFNQLGLIIVDEEHENTFKQYDPAPRYNGRDAALFLARLHGAKTLLGSATPSIESYHHALSGKYGLVQLHKRYLDMEMPEILVADIKELNKKRQMKSLFSPELLQLMKEALENKEQIILFQNRRGFSPFIQCKTCAWIPRCKNCDVTLTYHKHINQLVCHYCAFSDNMPNNCMACGDTAMNTKGFGTEKIEDELPLFFPEAKIARMDVDTTRSRNAYQQLISDFENRKIDILVGTQMIAKGLDFENVSIVGILNADNMLNFPDFRAFERSYQLMTQVSGRAGRKLKRGKVVIQTTLAKHNIVTDVITGNYYHMYETQIAERKNFLYPPFCRLIRIAVKHKNETLSNSIANQLALMFRGKYPQFILGPEKPLIARIQNYYLMNILVKIPINHPLESVKIFVKQCINELKARFQAAFFVIDVDPN